MIDLNSLGLYKEKISLYVDEQMPLPSPKDILILNDELIDNYTGNGITHHSSVKIDENDIATGLRRDSYILTGLSADILNTGNFEIQTKFKLTSLRFQF